MTGKTRVFVGNYATQSWINANVHDDPQDWVFCEPHASVSLSGSEEWVDAMKRDAIDEMYREDEPDDSQVPLVADPGWTADSGGFKSREIQIHMGNEHTTIVIHEVEAWN